MATALERNQFRRLIGDFKTTLVSDANIDALFNDTVLELTGDFATPLVDFNTLLAQYHNEVIYKAALNFMWNRLGELQEKHSISVGAATQNVGEKWDRLWQMIQWLQTQYDEIQQLRIDITIGNYSRYSKQTLRRIGGTSEENTKPTNPFGLGL